MHRRFRRSYVVDHDDLIFRPSYAAIAAVWMALAASAKDSRGTRALRKLFGECFVTGTPVAVGVGHEMYYAGPTAIASEDDRWSGAWLVAGIATLAATQMLGDERRHRRRWARSWLNQTFNLPSAEPEMDVCDLDFDEVCEDLMMGATSS